MKKENIKMSREEKENTRLIAVKMIVKGKIKPGEVAKIVGVDNSTISKWHTLYKKGGWKALKSKTNKGGRPKDKEKNLTDKEKLQLKKMLSGEPREIKELHLDFGLWTIKIIQKVIKEIFGKNLKEWKVKEFLNEIGYSNQKPIFRAYQQDPEKVEKWIKEELPGILTESQIEGRDVWYGDEAGFKSNDNRGKTRAPIGETPVVKNSGARFGINAISSINSKGEMRFMVYEGGFTSKTLIKFLNRIIHGNTRKFTLILDGHATHKSKEVKEYLKNIGNRVKLYYLPGYSPEHNPDELLWHCVKMDLKGTIYRNKQALCEKLLKTLYSHQKQISKIKSFFEKEI